jgi:hypothetical protein
VDCITGVGQQQNAPLTQQTKEAIVDVANTSSRVAGVIAAGATAVAAQGGPYAEPVQIVGMGATAVGAAADTVEQILKPNVGQVVTSSTALAVQTVVEGSSTGKILSSVTNELLEAWKASGSTLSLQNWINKQFQEIGS